MIFLDASVLLATEDSDDPNHAAATTLLGGGGALATLELAAYEVTNIAELRWRDTAAGQRLRERVWTIAELGALVRVDRRLSERVADLSREHRLRAYDAAYAAGAERLGAELASCDERDLVSRGLARLPRELIPRRAR